MSQADDVQVKTSRPDPYETYDRSRKQEQNNNFANQTNWQRLQSIEARVKSIEIKLDLLIAAIEKLRPGS